MADSSISRRAFLRATPAAIVAASVPAVAVAAQPEMSLTERIDNHIAELVRLMKESDPSIYAETIKRDVTGYHAVPLLITLWRRVNEWDGDGIYEVDLSTGLEYRACRVTREKQPHHDGRRWWRFRYVEDAGKRNRYWSMPTLEHVMIRKPIAA